MKKWIIATVIVLLTAVAVVGSILFWAHWLKGDALKHDTERWAVIEDSNGDRIAVEPLSDNIWSQLSQLYSNKSIRWVGGIVERYDNKWGFRFKPENITIAEVTAEGLQATIKWISEDLYYWLNLRWVYISAKVTEIHGSLVI